MSDLRRLRCLIRPVTGTWTGKIFWGGVILFHCSHIHQGDHDISLHWFCWLTIVFRTTVMVPKSKCARPWHMDVVSLATTQTGMQKARRKFQLWYSKICHGPRRPSSYSVRHSSFASPPLTSFGYYAIWSYLSRENCERFNHSLNVPESCDHGTNDRKQTSSRRHRHDTLPDTMGWISDALRDQPRVEIICVIITTRKTSRTGQSGPHVNTGEYLNTWIEYYKFGILIELSTTGA